MNIGFKNHFSSRFVEITFDADVRIETPAQLLEIQRRWQENTLLWHTPHSCIVHLTHFSIAHALIPEWNRMIHMLHGFHLQKIVAVVPAKAQVESNNARYLEIGFENVVATLAEAKIALGVREKNNDSAEHPTSAHASNTLKRSMQTTNHFDTRIMEIQFSSPVTMRTEDDVIELRSRIEYNIHQWHTDYCVLFNCENFVIEASSVAEFEKMQRFFRSFFCKTFVGYASQSFQSYPFRVFRTREAAIEACKELMQKTTPISSGARSGESIRPTF
jgi:hypothetical protein